MELVVWEKRCISMLHVFFYIEFFGDSSSFGKKLDIMVVNSLQNLLEF